MKAIELHHPHSPWVAGLLPFTVEDEYGGLEYMQGELPSMMTKPPVMDAIFSDQLCQAVQKCYDRHQLAIWGSGAGIQFNLKLGLGWSVEIIPIFVQGEKYTVSLFSPSDPSAAAH